MALDIRIRQLLDGTSHISNGVWNGSCKFLHWRMAKQGASELRNPLCKNLTCVVTSAM